MTAPLTESEYVRVLIAVILLQVFAAYGAWRVLKDHVEPHVTKWIVAGLTRLFRPEP